MRVEILGTRGNIAASARGHTRHSGVLVDGRILLDLGEPSYLRRRPRAIFISHLHPDHAAFMRRDLAINVPLFLPEPYPGQPQARILSRATRVGRYRVTPVPTLHSVHQRSCGFVVEAGGKRLFYSSDLFAIAPRYWRRLRHLDAVITDGSFLRRGGMVRQDSRTGQRFGHGGIPDLVEFFRRFTRRIIFTHFGSWFFKDVRASTRRLAALGNDNLEVSAARDGMIVDI